MKVSYGIFRLNRANQSLVFITDFPEEALSIEFVEQLVQVSPDKPSTDPNGYAIIPVYRSN
jgi:hypothetical protein